MKILPVGANLFNADRRTSFKVIYRACADDQIYIYIFPNIHHTIHHISVDQEQISAYYSHHQAPIF